MAFTGGTIRGDIQMVSFRRPDSGIHKPVQQFMGTIEETHLLHVRIYGYGFKILRGNLYIRFHQHILKAEYRKGGLVFIQPFFTYVFYFLERGGLFAHGKLKVFLSKFTIGIQHFTKPKHDLLSGMSL